MKRVRFLKSASLVFASLCITSSVFAQDGQTVDPLDSIQARLNESAILLNTGTDSLPPEYQDLTPEELRELIARLEREKEEDEEKGVQDEKRDGSLDILKGLLAGLIGGGQGGGSGGGGDCTDCQGGSGGGFGGGTSANNPPVTQVPNIRNKQQKNASAGPVNSVADRVLSNEKAKVINTATGQITDGELVSASVLKSSPIAEFSGATKSSILFWPPQDTADPDGPRQRTEMPLEMHGSGAFLNNLSVDDELFKTSWSQFQSKDYVQRSFLQGEKDRDRFLDSFDSARGVAFLTLSYLDKTVAAGLSTVQQQADMDYSHQLLKQVSWSSARLANPNRDTIYYDVDEKFEACMMTYGHLGGNPMRTTDKSTFVSGHVDIKEDESCKKCEQVASKETSPYHYCVCCAENAEKVNTSLKNESTDSKIFCGKGKDCYSLIERVFVGLELPTASKPVGFTGDQASFNPADALASFASQFRSLYGDIIMVPHEGSKGDFKQVFIHPYLSPATWIKVIRDFETVSRQYSAVKQCDNKSYGAVSVQYCPALGEVYKEGVCPALLKTAAIRKDVGQWEKWMSTKEDELTSLVVQASAGGVIDVRTIDAIANMDAFIVTEEGQVQINNPEQLAAINTVCDQASVGAFKSIHLKMVSVVMDHLLLSRKVTNYEKEQVYNMMNRVSRYLDLASQDNDSYVRSLVAGLNAEDSTNRATAIIAGNMQAKAHVQRTHNFNLTPLGGASFGGV